MSWHEYHYNATGNANLPPAGQYNRSLPGQPAAYGGAPGFQHQSQYGAQRHDVNQNASGGYMPIPQQLVQPQQHVHRQHVQQQHVQTPHVQQSYSPVLQHPQIQQHHISPQFPSYGYPQTYHQQYYTSPVQNHQALPQLRQYPPPQPIPSPSLPTQAQPPPSTLPVQAQSPLPSIPMPAQGPPLQPVRQLPPISTSQPQHRQHVAAAVPAQTSKPQRKKTPVPAAPPLQEQRVQVKLELEDLPPVDHEKLLLSLAEEFISAAHSLAPRVARDGDQRGLDEYSKLVSTGLGCMEAVLKNFRLHPRQEASLRLRYATILTKETENHEYAELVLTKGVTLCDRNKLLDLKYGSQHLLARVLFETQPRAALKSLDKYIQDVEAYQHVSWIYAFRFLRAMLSMQSPSHVDISAGLSNLRSIFETASRRGDQMIAVMASVMEAFTHLLKTNPESVQQTQYAIAQARKLQQQSGGGKTQPIWRLLDCVHLASALQSSDRDQAKSVMQAMHESMDTEGERGLWSDDGSFEVELASHASGLTDDTGGVFRKTASGQDALVFSWLRHDEVYLLAYYLSGFTMDLHLMNDGRAQEFLKSASIKLQEEVKNTSAAGSLCNQLERRSGRNLLQWQIHLHEAFTAGTREDWNGAQSILDQLFTSVQTNQVPGNLFRWATYLSGLIAQGRGRLDEALSIFQSEVFSLPSAPSVPDLFDPYLTLRVLANLHALLIIRDPAHPKHARCDALLATLDRFCASHPNRSIVSLYHIIRTVADAASAGGVMSHKRSLQQALSECKAISNNQLLRVCMGLVCSKFFPGVVSEQGLKSARVFERLSKDNQLWSCVSAGNMASTLEVNSHRVEAEKVRRQSVALVEQLPAGLRRKCEL